MTQLTEGIKRDTPTNINNKDTWGTKIANFIYAITGATLYYVKAYAINVDGTGYGNEITFTTVPLPRWALMLMISSIAAIGGIFVYRKFI